MGFELTDDEWKSRLTELEYQVLRNGATEPAFVGEYTDSDTVGIYSCKACGVELFRSESKFHSGCGWPSFFQPASFDSVIEIPDSSHGMNRIEVRCKNCDSHLGHVFSGEGFDTPTNLRYCINSIAMTLEPIVNQQ